MEAKIEKISELSKLLSVKTRMSDDLFHLFGKFGIGHLLSRLSLEKQDGVSASELLLSLCLFRIVGESIHSICKHKIYELSNHGKNCFYRMMIRPQMDWRRLMNHFALRYMCLLRKYGEVPQSDTTTCFIIDDTVLEKSGVRMEGISRVFDHMKGRCVLGYKLLLCAFFDGKTTIPFDFSLHQEKGKQGNYGRQDSNAERHIIPRGIPAILIISAFKSVRFLSWKSPWICFVVDGRWACMRSM